MDEDIITIMTPIIIIVVLLITLVHAFAYANNIKSDYNRCLDKCYCPIGSNKDCNSLRNECIKSCAIVREPINCKEVIE